MSHVNCNNIILVGFRTTGKTFIGRDLAKSLDWELIEMDELIEEKAGMSINDFTKQGTEWQNFRQLEQDVLVEVLQKDKVVISVGGGVGVNNIVKDGTEKTFGEINRDTILESSKNDRSLVVLLQSTEEVLKTRIENSERMKLGTRPILNEDLASEVEEKVINMNEEEKKEYIIQKVVEDSMKMYKIRKPLYEMLSDNIVDTSTVSIEENVNEVMGLMELTPSPSLEKEGNKN